MLRKLSTFALSLFALLLIAPTNTVVVYKPNAALRSQLFIFQSGSAMLSTMANSTRYSSVNLTVHGSTQWHQTAGGEADHGTIVTAGTVTDLRCVAAMDTPAFDIGGVGVQLDVTLRKNGVATALAASLAGTAGTGSGSGDEVFSPATDTDVVTTADGDVLSYEWTLTGTVTNPGTVTCTTKFTPSRASEWVMAGQASLATDRYLPPGVTTIHTASSHGGSTDAAGRVPVPTAGTIEGIQCKATGTPSSTHTIRVYLNGAQQTSLNCSLTAANGTNRVEVRPTPIAVAQGDTLSIFYDVGTTADTDKWAWTSLLYKPTTAGRFWAGLASATTDWNDTDNSVNTRNNQAPVQGWMTAASTAWNNLNSFFPPSTLHFQRVLLNLDTMVTGAQTLTGGLAYHAEDPANADTNTHTALVCPQYDAGAASLCTVTSDVQATGDRFYQWYWTNMNVPGSSAWRAAIEMSLD